jgi:hypothetical protein
MGHAAVPYAGYGAASGATSVHLRGGNDGAGGSLAGELKYADTVKGKLVKVAADSLCIEVLTSVRDAVINAVSMGVTPMLYTAAQYLFSADMAFFTDLYLSVS